MQTFLPYKSFARSAACLDNKRLGKQRVEAMQILDILCTKHKKKLGQTDYRAWSNHPAVLQWEGHEGVLFSYLQDICAEWIKRGFNNNGMDRHLQRLSDSYHLISKHLTAPSWLGNRAFHASYKSRLLQKDLAFYSKYKWKVPLDLEYYWPVRKQ